jgi:hypothetical protein
MFLLAASTTAGAQQAAIFACIANHAEPSAEIVVPGFQGERLYLHAKHPDSCRTGSADCASSAYVVTFRNGGVHRQGVIYRIFVRR